MLRIKSINFSQENIDNIIENSIEYIINENFPHVKDKINDVKEIVYDFIDYTVKDILQYLEYEKINSSKIIFMHKLISDFNDSCISYNNLSSNSRILGYDLNQEIDNEFVDLALSRSKNNTDKEILNSIFIDHVLVKLDFPLSIISKISEYDEMRFSEFSVNDYFNYILESYTNSDFNVKYILSIMKEEDIFNFYFMLFTSIFIKFLSVIIEHSIKDDLTYDFKDTNESYIILEINSLNKGILSVSIIKRGE